MKNTPIKKALHRKIVTVILTAIIVFFNFVPHSYSQKDNNGAYQDSDSPKFTSRVYHDVGYAAKTSFSDFKYIYSSPTRINTKYALWLGGLLAVGGTLFAFDQEIYDAIHRNKNHKLYKPIRNMGETLEPLGYMGYTNKFMFGSLVIGYIIKNELMVNISVDLLEIFFISGLGKKATMNFIGREGPVMENGPRSFEFFEGRSFPSGHSNAIMQLASVMSHHIDYLPFQVAAYGGASTVLLQRITSDAHWPSDVFTGAVYGWVISHELLKLKKSRRMKMTPMTFYDGKGTGLMVTFGF